MSKIEEMIKRLCPNGVERVPVWRYTAWDKKFNAVDKSMQKSINKYKYLLAKDLEEIKDNSGDIRILYTTEEIAYTTEEKAGNYISEGEVIAIPWGGTPSVKYYKGRFITGDNRIATSTDAEKLSNKYLYYVLLDNMKTISKFYRGAGIKHPSMYSILTLEIPLPPLTIQREIVSVLDSFTTLIDKMKQEVELRKKQMEYYREKLLSFEGEECDWNTLKELFVIKNGLNKEKKDFGIGTPIINYVDVYKNRGLHKDDIKGLVNSNESELSRFKCTKGDVFFTRTSETKEEVGFPSVLLDDIENCVFSGFLLKATPITDKLDAHYCKYCFFTNQFRQEVEKRATLTTRALTNSTSLYKISIPIPPLSTQHSIVSTLDAFEQYISKLERLITLREKQYAYYREKLLTFE